MTPRGHSLTIMNEEECMYDEDPDFVKDFEGQFQDELDMITEIDEPVKSKVPAISTVSQSTKLKPLTLTKKGKV